MLIGVKSSLRSCVVSYRKLRRCITEYTITGYLFNLYRIYIIKLNKLYLYGCISTIEMRANPKVIFQALRLQRYTNLNYGRYNGNKHNTVVVIQ